MMFDQSTQECLDLKNVLEQKPHCCHGVTAMCLLL